MLFGRPWAGFPKNNQLQDKSALCHRRGRLSEEADNAGVFLNFQDLGSGPEKILGSWREGLRFGRDQIYGENNGL